VLEVEKLLMFVLEGVSIASVSCGVVLAAISCRVVGGSGDNC
jgi:hypothetical protein